MLAREVQLIDDGLRLNRKLVGLHIEQEGFVAIVDPLGFIDIDTTSIIDASKIHQYPH